MPVPTERLERLRRDWSVFASRHKPAPRVAPPKKNQTLDLRALWNSISVLSSMEEKIFVLQEMARRQYEWLSTKQLRKRRRKFNRRKYSILRLTDSECYVCGALADIRHHVIQLQNGGHNEMLNVIPLCCGCHGEIHPWLAGGRSGG